MIDVQPILLSTSSAIAAGDVFVAEGIVRPLLSSLSLALLIVTLSFDLKFVVSTTLLLIIFLLRGLLIILFLSSAF